MSPDLGIALIDLDWSESQLHLGGHWADAGWCRITASISWASLTGSHPRQATAPDGD